jgi:hypothetical protein
VPSPEPLLPDVTVSHAAEDDAVHEHEPPVDTPTEPLAASAPDETLVGESATSQVPACSTVTVRPDTVRVPVRGVVEVLAATEKVTAALPLLFGPPPDVTVIHDELLNAVQTHPDGIVTETTREPPVASTDSVVDESVATQDAAVCVTVSSRPPIAIEPVRLCPAGLASTRYVTVPLPVPDAPLSTVIHDTPEIAAHEHPPGTVMSTLPFPPADAMFCELGVSAASHAAPAWVTTKGCPATVIVAERELLSLLAATT